MVSVLQNNKQDCKHEWRYCKDYWVEGCVPAICVKCGVLGCICDVADDCGGWDKILSKEIFFREGQSMDFLKNKKGVSRKIMCYKEFERYIKKIEKNREKVNRIAETLNWDGAFDLTMEEEVIKLLSYIFKDKSEWISYWIYELNFGQDWYVGRVTEDGKDVNLLTTKNLYNVLIKNMEENHSGEANNM